MKNGSTFIATIALLIGLFLLAGSAIPTMSRTTDDRPLKITSKARPVYPEEARKAGVQGTVTVAITFNADGTIGEVVCAIEDPDERERFERYGLVESSIQAARKIEFEPEIKDGKAITVTKRSSYSFAIF